MAAHATPQDFHSSWPSTHSTLTASTAYASKPYDCDTGLANWENSWSHSKQAWCCVSANVGCPNMTKKMHYDCADSNIDSWPLAKRSWCCFKGYPSCDTSASSRVMPTFS